MDGALSGINGFGAEKGGVQRAVKTGSALMCLYICAKYKCCCAPRVCNVINFNCVAGVYEIKSADELFHFFPAAHERACKFCKTARAAAWAKTKRENGGGREGKCKMCFVRFIFTVAGERQNNKLLLICKKSETCAVC
jgi:hypothetical protein